MLKILLTLITLSAISCTGKGIVVVDGWKHGVALCEGEKRESAPMFEIDGGWMWMKQGVLYVVNDDHLGDDQLVELMQKARQTCSKYQE